MKEKFSGKVALVTGGSTGIGLATAVRLAEEGAFVYITGRRQAELDAAVKLIGKSARGVQGDVSNLDDLDRLYATIQAEKGRLDIVFANAGGGSFASLAEVTGEQFDKEFAINVKGALFTVQKALPYLKEGASVILNASVVSIKGMENFGVYSATKAALRSLARTWVVELKGRNIRVNVVSPGPIETPAMTGLAGSEEAAQALKGNLASGVPLGRIGQPDEIAKAVSFLASEESSFITGIELFVDGGYGQI
ncbi:SDR family oxidoreductase [soil metagenome]